MVRITRVHTGGGDAGETSLLDGTRVAKSALRLELVGAVDELNSMIGVVRMEVERMRTAHEDGGSRATVRTVQQSARGLIAELQHELFDLGAELACPPERLPAGVTLLPDASNGRLVAQMDAWIEELEPLTSFILPTGVPPVAWLQVARAACRRAERVLVSVRDAEGEGSVRSEALAYLNRLSDWLFVLARWITMRLGESEALWVPVDQRGVSTEVRMTARDDRDDDALDGV